MNPSQHRGQRVKLGNSVVWGGTMVGDAVTLSAQVMTAVLTTVSSGTWRSVRPVLEEAEASPQSALFRDEINSVAEVLNDPSNVLDRASRMYVLQTCEASLRKYLEKYPELQNEYRSFVSAVDAALQRHARPPTESSLLRGSSTGSSTPQISIETASQDIDLINEDRRYIDWRVDWESLLAKRSELLSNTHMEFSGERITSAKSSTRIPSFTWDPSTLASLTKPPFELLPSDLYGKEDTLSGLEGQLDEPDGNIHLLCGEPGAGKRIAALAIAANAEERGKQVWWVRATPELIGASMTAVAVQLNADPSELAEARAGRRSMADLVWEYLEQAKVPWLLIFDDVDDRATLERFLPSDEGGSGWIRPSKAGIVLITSRYSGANTSFRHLAIHQIRPFGSEDAVRFLMTAAPAAGTRQDAAELAIYLEGLPLACKLAACYINSPATSATTFQAYLAELKRAEESREANASRREEDPWLFLTVRIILQSMNRNQNAAAWTVLAILSYYAPGAPLTSSVLDQEALSGVGLSPWREGETEPQRILTESLDLLVSLGLIESTTTPADEELTSWRDIRIHPLISLACRLIVQDNLHVAGVPRELVWIAAATLLHRAADRQSRISDLNWRGGSQLIPHILALVVSLPDSSPSAALEEAVYASQLAMDNLLKTGSHLRAEQLGRRAIEISQNLPYDNLAALNVTYDLARILMERGRLGEAQELLQAMLATSQLTRGLDSKASIDALELLASVCHQRGETDQAEQLLRQVTRARERTLREVTRAHEQTGGLEAAATIRALTSLAWVLSEQGKLGEMERLSRNILSIVKDRYGADNRETLSAEMELGATFRVLGRIGESEQLLQRVLEAQKSLLGSDHPDISSTMAELAETFKDLGRLTAAKEMLVEVIERRSRALGVDDLDTVDAKAQLAEVLRDQANFNESMELLRQVLAVHRQTLGAEHPETLNTRLGLAVLLRDTGHLAQAEKTFDDVIAVCETSLQPDHPVVLSARHNLAAVFQVTGRIDEAEQLYRDVLDKREWTLGPNHPETLRTLVNLGSLLHLRGSLDDAEYALRQAETAYSELYGLRHPHTMAVQTNIANVLLDSGKAPEAKESYNEILEVQRSALGFDHPDTLATSVNLAVALIGLGDLYQADVLLTQAISGYERVFNTADHPSLLKARYHLAGLMERKGEWQEALDNYSAILELQVNKLGDNHPDSVATRFSISRVLETLGHDEASDLHYKRAIRLAAARSPQRFKASLGSIPVSGRRRTA